MIYVISKYVLSLDYCCKKFNLTLYETAFEAQGHRAGEYELASGKVNNRSHWERTDGSMVIWFNDQEDRWTIGSSVGSGGGIFANSSFECPGYVGDNWQYYNGSITYQDAVSDIQLECLGL